MKQLILIISQFIKTIFGFSQSTKAPAYPLITHDPYFSIWSNSNQLTDLPTKYWTGTDHSIMDFLKVDGNIYRFLGNQAGAYKNILPAGDDVNYETKYTESDPENGWQNGSFDDSQWKMD